MKQRTRQMKRDTPETQEYTFKWYSAHEQDQECVQLLQRPRTRSGIQFTMHFIEFIVVETKKFVGGNINVILTWQTCSQRSSRAAESKRQALHNYFYERIWTMFLMSKCREDWDLGLGTFWVIAKREPLRSGDFRKKNVFRPQEKLEFGIAQRFSFRKHPKSAQTRISVSSIFWYQEHMANSLVKIIL